jgi:DNA-binding response OmpR family regulator
VDAPADPWEEIVPIEASTKGSGNILVVEDDILLGDLVEVALSRAGYQVSVARNGEQALKIAANHRPDLVLTDIVMPGITGRDLIRTLRETSPEILAVYMTGYADDAALHRAELDDNAQLIEKPFSTGELLALIKTVMS